MSVCYIAYQSRFDYKQFDCCGDDDDGGGGGIDIAVESIEHYL